MVFMVFAALAITRGMTLWARIPSKIVFDSVANSSESTALLKPEGGLDGI
jgi:hypothetical protein